MKTLDDLKIRLKKFVERECWCDDKDFSPADYAGGNYDDAYFGGVSDGVAILAREVLEVLGEDQ